MENPGPVVTSLKVNQLADSWTSRGLGVNQHECKVEILWEKL